MRKTIFLLALFILTIGGQKMYAQTEESSCSIEAWVTDKDPKGLNVRSQPNAASKILGTLKITGNDNDDEIVVNIIGYSNGWVKIRKAENSEFEAVFEGTGWISAEKVTTRAQRLDGNMKKGVTLYAKPSSKSKKLGTVPNEEPVKVIGYDCFGLKVKYKNKTGWVQSDQLCGNPVTTCS